jgi:hypothetical protein
MTVRQAVVVWSAGVLAAALSLAVLLAGRVQTPLWHNLWFVLSAVAAGAAFLILIVSGMPDLVGWLRGRGPTARVNITYPTADQRVHQAETARGLAERVPDGVALWLVVKAGRTYYPQARIHLPVGGTAEWTQLVHFGRINGSYEKPFTLYAVGADSAASSQFDAYMRRQDGGAVVDGLRESRGEYPRPPVYSLVNVTRGY